MLLCSEGEGGRRVSGEEGRGKREEGRVRGGGRRERPCGQRFAYTQVTRREEEGSGQQTTSVMNNVTHLHTIMTVTELCGQRCVHYCCWL